MGTAGGIFTGSVRLSFSCHGNPPVLHSQLSMPSCHTDGETNVDRGGLCTSERNPPSLFSPAPNRYTQAR